MSKLEDLAHLATRLESVAQGEFCRALALVRRVMAQPTVLRRGDAEHAFYWTLWGYVSVALDRGDYDRACAAEVRAIEAEMAGRTLLYRQERGWLLADPQALAAIRGMDDYFGDAPAAEGAAAT